MNRVASARSTRALEDASGEHSSPARAAAPTDAAATPVRHFNHLIIDGFLPQQLRDQLLGYTLANAEQFHPTKIANSTYTDGAIDPSFRQSWYCQRGLGELTDAFRDVVKEHSSRLMEELGVSPFQVHGIELELAAHRHGSFFRRHIDTVTRAARDVRSSDRIVTGVYYFHTIPKKFEGGELALAPLGRGEPKLVEPHDNRLVAFASFVPHEVREVVIADNDFSHARFAVNIWLHRARTTD